MSPGYYSSGDVMRKLRLSVTELSRLRDQGAIAHVRFGKGHTRYDQEFIHKLTALWNKYPGELRHPCDTQFFKLLTLQWAYNHPPPACDTHKKILAHRERIKHECDDLVLLKKAYTTQLLAAEIGKEASAVYFWARRKKIMAVRVGGVYYMSARYAACIMKPFLEWHTLIDVAEMTGLPNGDAVAYRVRKGDAPAVRCLDGMLRMSTEAAMQLVPQELDVSHGPLLTLEEAATKLGVAYELLAWEVNNDRVVSVGSRTSLRIPVSEVEMWQNRFAHLNAAFAWLEPMVIIGGKKPLIMEPKIVMKELDLSPTALTEWSQAGLLPFFVWSFTTGSKDRRFFVRRYVRGLRAFAGQGTKLNKRIARRYLELCRSHNQIM